MQLWKDRWCRLGMLAGLILSPALVVIIGCATVDSDIIHPLPVWEGSVTNVGAVCIGLQRTAEGVICAGAEKDARQCAARLSAAGVEVTLVLNQEATAEGIETVIRAAAGRYDKVIVTWSGHGGLERDEDGDEPDGWDTFLVTYNRHYLDDEYGRLVQTLPAKVWLLFLTDTCHAEGAWRRTRRGVVQLLTVGLGGRKEPLIMIRRLESGCAVIQIAGCRKQASSFGTDQDGGVLTSTFWSIGPETKTTHEAFQATYEASPPWQKPVLTTNEKVRTQFMHGPALR